MPRSVPLIIALAALMVAGAIFFRLSQMTGLPESNPSTPALASPGVTPLAAVTSASAPPVVTPSPTASRQEIPTAEEMSRESAANPHQTPPSLLRFARELATRVRQAKTNVDDARSLFTELESCAADPTPGSVQAICLAQAQSLKTSFPEALSERYDRMLEHASPEATRLLQAVKSLSQ